LLILLCAFSHSAYVARTFTTPGSPAQGADVAFNWTPMDFPGATNVTCNLTLDGTVISAYQVCNVSQNCTFNYSNIGPCRHEWEVVCNYTDSGGQNIMGYSSSNHFDVPLTSCGKIESSSSGRTCTLANSLSADSGTCLEINATDLTLNCNNKQIACSGSCGYGIFVRGSGVTVENCSVSGFRYGLSTFSGDLSGLTISRSSFFHSTFAGADINGMSSLKIYDSQFYENKEGLRLSGSGSDAEIARSSFYSNEETGVYVLNYDGIAMSSCNLSLNIFSGLNIRSSKGVSVSASSISQSAYGFVTEDSENVHISGSKIFNLQYTEAPSAFGLLYSCENCGISDSNASSADFGFSIISSNKFFVINTNISGVPCSTQPFSSGIYSADSQEGAISKVRIPMPTGPGICYTILLNNSLKTSVSGAWLNGSTEGFVAVDSPQSSLSSSTVANVPAINVRIQDSADFDLNDTLVNHSSLGVLVNNSPGFKMMRTTVTDHMSMLSPVFPQHSLVLLDSGGSMVNGSTITKSVVGIYAEQSQLTVDSSALYNNSEIAVNLTDSGTSTISSSEVGLSKAGISAFRSKVYVRSNSIMNISNISVLLNLSSQSEVTSNVIDRAWIAIAGSDSSNLGVSFNNISSVDIGILLNNSQDATINKNRIINFDYFPPKYGNPEFEPENILAAGIFASYSPRLVVSRNTVMENFWDGAVQLFDCPDSDLWSNNFSMAGTCMSLFNCSHSSFYDNRFNDCRVFVDNESTDMAASITPSGGTNILGCGTKGGNAWTSSSSTGVSDTCENLDGDCFCDYPPSVAAGEYLNDSHPLAVHEGSDFTVRPDSMNGRALDARERYDRKEYVAATQEPNQLITFSILTKVPGNYACHLMPPLSGSDSLGVNETVGIGGISTARAEGCYPLVVNCSYSPAPTVSKLSKPAYFCVDRTVPTIEFGQRSQAKSRIYNPYDGETVNSSTFTLNLSASDNNRHTFISACVIEVWNQTSSELMGNMSFEPTNSGAFQYCSINVKLGNGEFRYRVFALDSAENYDGTGYRTVIVNGHPSGCDECENVNDFDPSTILLTTQSGANKIKAVLYFDNASTGTRQPVPGAPIAVWIRNSTDRYLTKIVTDGQGVAYLDYSGWKDARKEYSFIYCCFYEECGFEMCLNASGVDDAYRDANGIYSVDTIPTMPNQPEASMERHYLLPALKKIDISPDAQDLYAQLQQSLCIPIFILFGLLMAALYYTGRNPFGFLDLSPLRVGRHIRYSPRGMMTGFRVSTQTMAGVGTRVGSSAVKPMAGPTSGLGKTMMSVGKTMGRIASFGIGGDKSKSKDSAAASKQDAGAGKQAAGTQAKGPGFFVRFVKQTIKQESAPFRNIKNLVAPSAESKGVGLGSRLAMTLFGGDISAAGAKIAQGGPAKPVSKVQDSAASQLRVDPNMARQFGMGTGAGAGWIGMLGFLGMRGAALSSLAGIVYQSMDAARKKSVAYGDTTEIEKQLGAIGVKLSDKQRSELGNLGLKSNRSITLAGPRGTTYIASLAKGGKIRVQEQASFSRQIFRFITALTGFSSLMEMKDTVKAVRLVNSIDRDVNQKLIEAKQTPEKLNSEQLARIKAGEDPITHLEALQMRYNQTNKGGSGMVSDNVYRVAQELLNQRAYMQGLSFGRAFGSVFATTAVGSIFGTMLASSVANKIYNRSMNEAQAEKIMRDAKLIGKDGIADSEKIRDFLADPAVYAKKHGLYLGQVAQAFDVFSENFKKARQEATPVLNEIMLPELLIKPELRLESSVLNASLVRSKASKPLISIIKDIVAEKIPAQSELESKIATAKLNETEANFARISFSLMRQEPITIRQFEQLSVAQKALGIESPALDAVSSGLKKRVDEILTASPAEQSRIIFEQESRSFLQSRGISYQEFQKASEALVQQLVTAGQAKADYSYPNEGARSVIDGLVKSMSQQLDEKDSETVGRMMADAANHSISETRVNQKIVTTFVDLLAMGARLPKTQRTKFETAVFSAFFRTSLTKDEQTAIEQELKTQGFSKIEIGNRIEQIEDGMRTRSKEFFNTYDERIKENPQNLTGAIDQAMKQTKDEDSKLQAALYGLSHGLADSVLYSTQSAKELSKKLTEASGSQQYIVPLQKEPEQYLSQQLSVERHAEPDYTSANAHMAQRMWNYGDEKKDKAALQNYLSVEWLAENAPNMAAAMLKDEARDAARKYMEKHASDAHEETITYSVPHSAAARIEQKVNQSAQTTSLEMAVDIALDNSKPDEKSEVRIRNNGGILEFLVPQDAKGKAEWQNAEELKAENSGLIQSVLSAAGMPKTDLFAPKLAGVPTFGDILKQMLDPKSESAKPISISPQFHAQSYRYERDKLVVGPEVEIQYLKPEEPPIIYIGGEQYDLKNSSHRDALASAVNLNSRGQLPKPEALARTIVTENYTDKGEQSGDVPVRLEPEKITVFEGSRGRRLERDDAGDRFLLANLVKEAKTVKGAEPEPKPAVDVAILAERLKDRKLFNSAVEFVTAPETFTINLSSPAGETLAPVTVGKSGPVSNPESADYTRAGFNLVHGHKPSKEESAAIEQSAPVGALYKASAAYDSARLAYEYESEREKKRSYLAHMGIGSLDNEELFKQPASRMPDFEINMVNLVQPKSRPPQPPQAETPSAQPAASAKPTITQSPKGK